MNTKLKLNRVAIAMMFAFMGSAIAPESRITDSGLSGGASSSTDTDFPSTGSSSALALTAAAPKAKLHITDIMEPFSRWAFQQETSNDESLKDHISSLEESAKSGARAFLLKALVMQQEPVEGRCVVSKGFYNWVAGTTTLANPGNYDGYPALEHLPEYHNYDPAKYAQLLTANPWSARSLHDLSNFLSDLPITEIYMNANYDTFTDPNYLNDPNDSDNSDNSTFEISLLSGRYLGRNRQNHYATITMRVTRQDFETVLHRINTFRRPLEGMMDTISKGRVIDILCESLSRNLDRSEELRRNPWQVTPVRGRHDSYQLSVIN